MTEQEEAILRADLAQQPKEKIIDLFVKLKKIHHKTCERLEKVENELNEMTDIQDLIDNLPD